MIKLSLVSVFLLSLSQFSVAEQVSTEAYYSESPYVNIEPSDSVEAIVFTANSSPISDNVSVKTVKRSSDDLNKYVYCLVEKDINAISAESMIKKTCVNEFGEGALNFVKESTLDMNGVSYLEYTIPANKKLDYFAIDTVDIGKPNLDYIDLVANEKRKAYLVYAFNPTNGKIKQNIIYLLK